MKGTADGARTAWRVRIGEEARVPAAPCCLSQSRTRCGPGPLTWRVPQEAPAAERGRAASQRGEGTLEDVLEGWEARNLWATTQRCAPPAVHCLPQSQTPRSQMRGVCDVGRQRTPRRFRECVDVGDGSCVCRVLELARDQQVKLPDHVRHSLRRAADLHKQCCEQERLQELVHQGLRCRDRAHSEWSYCGRGVPVV